MAIEVFSRYEKKYLLDERTRKELQAELENRMDVDAYNKTQETYAICNIYYDTPDSYLIRTSLSKPRYKEKLRLRSYGVPDLDTKVYAEIKKKTDKLVNKRRSTLILSEAYEFLQSGRLPADQPYMNQQVLREIQYLLACHQLEPALYIAYDRRAYFGANADSLRISFDNNIRTRRRELRLEAGDYGEPLLEKGKTLMEIKASGGLPIWLCRLLSDYKIYPVCFSKYGRAYTKQIEQAQKGGIFFSAPRLALEPVILRA
jgi:SPX domain protein involved in polyphosphate accumulation